MIILARGAKDADVAGVGEGRAEFGDDEGDARGFADGVFFANENVEWFARGSFAEPWLQIV